VLVRTLLTGIDGTDEEILREAKADPPEGEAHLVLGHECLGEVVEAPEGAGLAPGDLVVPLVRHGCGGCERCHRGEADLCPTDDYREHGIKGLHGFMREYWTDTPEHLVKAPRGLGRVAVLTEPLSIVVKALEASRHIQQRIPWFEQEGGFRGKRALLAGTGSLGSLGAFLLVEAGMEVWAMDRTSDDAFGSRLLADLGVRHVNVKERSIHDVAREHGRFDLIIEATGVPKVVFDTVLTLEKNGIMCMLGVPAQRPAIQVEADDVMRQMVMGNQVLFGSVNSNRRHFEQALEALQRFRDRWGDRIDRVLTHTYAPEEHEEAFHADEADLVKKAIVWREP